MLYEYEIFVDNAGTGKPSKRLGTFSFPEPIQVGNWIFLQPCSEEGWRPVSKKEVFCLNPNSPGTLNRLWVPY